MSADEWLIASPLLQTYVHAQPAYVSVVAPYVKGTWRCASVPLWVNCLLIVCCNNDIPHFILAEAAKYISVDPQERMQVFNTLRSLLGDKVAILALLESSRTLGIGTSLKL